MPYADFTLDLAESDFGLIARPGDLFPDPGTVPVPDWLRDLLDRGQRIAALVSEKARSEFLVVPILIAACDIAPGPLSIYSGQRLDIDAVRGLTGEWDYILALTPPVPRLRAPLVTVLEAKKGDIEAGLGQCVAQMVGAPLQRAGGGGHRPGLRLRDHRRGLAVPPPGGGRRHHRPDPALPRSCRRHPRGLAGDPRPAHPQT